MPLTTNKLKLTISLREPVDEELRMFGARHRKQLSEIVEAALDRCLNDRQFITEMSKKKAPKP
jgi:hypothetical protein